MSERVCSAEGCGPIEGKSLRGMCKRHYNAWYRRNMQAKPDPKTLDIAPLNAFAERRGVNLGLEGARINRDLADEIACKTFKVHPSYIFGLDWDRANAA